MSVWYSLGLADDAMWLQTAHLEKSSMVQLGQKASSLAMSYLRHLTHVVYAGFVD